MKKLFSSLLVTILTGLLAYSPITFASTGDEATPANEGICNDLKADGVTKGLYGLCVAFCEAHDVISYSTPITEVELANLLDATPSEKILTNYNKKKTDNDPAMPCINNSIDNNIGVCPCWTEETIQSIDGIPEGTHGEPSTLTCQVSFMNEAAQVTITSIAEEFGTIEKKGVGAYETNDGKYVCSRSATPSNESINVELENVNEYNACITSVMERIDDFEILDDCS